MADQKSILNKLAQTMSNDTHKTGVELPAGNNQEKEIQYSEMDMIAGICSAALFGVANRDKDSYKNLTANPKLSYLGQILDILTNLTGYVKPNEDNKKKEQNNLLNLITSSKPIPVKLEEINKSAFNDIIIDVKLPSGLQNIIDVKLPENKQSTVNENQSTVVGKLILSIDKNKNIKELSEDLDKLTRNVYNNELLEGLSNVYTVLDSFNKLGNIDITKLTTAFNNIDVVLADLVKAFPKLNLELSENSAIKQLQKELLELEKITNNSSLLLAVTSLTSAFTEFNKVNLETGNLETNINNLNTLTKSLVQVMPELSENLVKLNSQTLDVKTDNLNSVISDIKELITKINEIPDSVKDIKVFDDENLNNILNGFTKTIEIINNNDVPEAKIISKKIEEVIKLLENDNLNKLFNKISLITNDLNIKNNIQGVGELIQSIISIAQFNTQIDKNAIKDLLRLTKKGGYIEQIINNINSLGLNTINKDTITSLEHLNEYFNSISTLTEISLLDKIRIITNILFFKNYVNKTLPELIKDVDKNFKDITLGNNKDTLINLTNYFSTLKNISDISIKDQIKILTSIHTFRHLIVENLGELVKDINKTFKDIELTDNINPVIELLENIKNLNIEGSFEEKRKSLNELYKFLFGSSPLGSGIGNDKISKGINKIGRGLDFVKGESSVLSIVNRLKSESSTFASLNEPIKNIETIFDSLNELLNTNIDVKDAERLSDTLGIFENNILRKLIKLSKDHKKDKDGKYPYQNGLDLIKDFKKYINESFRNTDLNKVLQKIVIGENTYKRFDETLKIFEKLKDLVNLINKTPELNEKAINNLNKLADNLVIVIDKFNKIDPQKINSVIKLFDQITKFVVISTGILIIGTIIMTQFTWSEVFRFVAGLSTMCLMFGGLFKIIAESKLSIDNIEEKISLMNELTKLVIALGFTLATCSLLMKNVKITDVLLFGVSTIALLTVSILIVKLLDKFGLIADKQIKFAQDLSILILSCGLSLGIASFLGQNTNPVSIIGFGFAISLLIASVMVPMIFFGGIKALMFEGVGDLGKLVLYCGITLALAGFVVKYIPLLSVLAFGAELGLLVAMVLAPLALISLAGGKASIQGAKDLGTLVMYSAAALLVGGLLFMLMPKLKPAVDEFANTLSWFTIKILFVAGICALLGKEALQHIKSLEKIITVAAAAMLIGGLAFLIGGLPYKKAVEEFTNTLIWFVAGIGLVVGLVGLFVSEKKLKRMWMLSLLVGISALAITLGPILIQHYGIPYSDIWQFVGASLLFVGGMALIVGLLSLIKPMALLYGVLATAAICLLIYGLGYAVNEIVKVLSYIKENKLRWKDIWIGIGNMVLIVLAIGVLATVLGAITMIPIVGQFISGAALIGGGVLAGIEALIWGLGKCVMSVVEATKALKEIQGFDMKALMKPFGDFIKEAAIAFSDVGIRKAVKLKFAISSFSSIGKVISSIAKGIKDYASLQIPIGFDENGKPIGYRKLESHDFTQAAENIGLVIATLGGAILAMYDGYIWDPTTNSKGQQILTSEQAKEIFDTNWLGKSKFRKITDSVSRIGKLITDISKGIQNYANLKIPVYDDNGNILKYDQFDKEYFKKASENIATIISTLGMSILALYNGYKWDPVTNQLLSIPNFTSKDAHEIFETNWVGKSQFRKVIDATSKIGNLISSIAKGIQDYATLTIPTAWDKDGKPTAWKKMTDEEFTKAGENIAKVIISLGQAVTTVANSGDFKTYYDLAKMKSIIESIGTVSNFIGPLANVLIEYAVGRFPELKYVDGKLVTAKLWQVKDWNKFQNLLTKNISHVLLGLGLALSKVLNSDDENHKKAIKLLTKDTEKVSNFVSNIQTLSNSLATIFENVHKVIAMKTYVNPMILHIRNPFNELFNLFAMQEGSAKSWFMENHDKVSTFIASIASFSSSLSNVFKDIKSILDYQLTGQLIIDNIGNPFSTYVGILANTQFEDFDNEKYNNLTNFNRTIEDWINIISKIDSAELPNKTNILSNSITEIFTKIAAQQEESKFADHVATLKEYVETINAVDVSKIESMTTLAYAVTDLGDKIGNIDKFTNTLADKVSNTLIKLSGEIGKASVIIKDADKLHAKRQSHIKASINEITKLMEKSMVVEIKNDQQQTGTTTDAFTGVTDTETKSGNSVQPISSGGSDFSGGTSDKSSETSLEKVTVDIDYDKLAEAIARAFKKING